MEERADIRDPSQIGTLRPAELVARVRPLLRRAKLTAHPEARERHEENVPAALAILLDRWDASPSSRLHKGRSINFEEFVAIHLANEVRQLDREQRPDLYDAHGRYFSSDAFAGVGPSSSLDEDERAAVASREPFDETAIASSDPLTHFAAGMTAAGISTASQPAAIRLLVGVHDGTVTNGRQSAKALGHSDYKARPATAPLLAAIELLDASPLRPHSETPSFQVETEPSRLV